MKHNIMYEHHISRKKERTGIRQCPPIFHRGIIVILIIILIMSLLPSFKKKKGGRSEKKL